MFEFASGSIVGKDHVLTGKNNQDAYCILNKDGIAVAVVTDGCGDSSSPYSEVGARIGANLTANLILKRAEWYIPLLSDEYILSDQFWTEVREDVLIQIKMIALNMGKKVADVVKNHFLFTTLGALVTEGISVFFALGDGVVIVNGSENVFSYPNNEPPYLGYALVRTTAQMSEISSSFARVQTMPTRDLDHFVLATDGLSDILGKPKLTIPGTSQEVGLISQLWTEDRFFANPDNLRRWLVQLNRHGQKIDWQAQAVMKYHGLLHDDTTLVVCRRSKAEEVDA